MRIIRERRRRRQASRRLFRRLCDKHRARRFPLTATGGGREQVCRELEHPNSERGADQGLWKAWILNRYISCSGSWWFGGCCCRADAFKISVTYFYYAWYGLFVCKWIFPATYTEKNFYSSVHAEKHRFL